MRDDLEIFLLDVVLSAIVCHLGNFFSSLIFTFHSGGFVFTGKWSATQEVRMSLKKSRKFDAQREIT
jgi:hypothetical protein